MDSAVADSTIITKPFYSILVHNCKGKLARRKEAAAIGKGEDLEHILAHEKWPFVNSLFLFK